MKLLAESIIVRGRSSVMRLIYLFMICAAMSTPSMQIVARNVPETQTVTIDTNEARNQWQPLFKTAKDTIHWRSIRETPFPNNGWIIKKRELILLPGRKGGDIVTKRKYNDFELKLEFKMTRRVNSGVKYFVNRMKNNERNRTEWVGFEYQIIDDFHQDEIRGFDDEKGSTSALYLLYAPNSDKKLKPLGSWNSMKIKVQDSTIEHWLNGEMVLKIDVDSPDFNDKVQETKFKNYADFGKLRDGYILIQDHGDQIHFRNIIIKEL